MPFKINEYVSVKGVETVLGRIDRTYTDSVQGTLYFLTKLAPQWGDPGDKAYRESELELAVIRDNSDKIFSRSPHQQCVDEFMRKVPQELPARPKVPGKKTRFLRAKLILEESMETLAALGFKLASEDDSATTPTVALDVKGITLNFVEQEPDLVEIIDGCADIIVVTTGTLSACGIPDSRFQREVDESNLRKFAPGSWQRDDGKWMKPKDWTPPNIKGLLDELNTELDALGVPKES